MWNIVVLDDNSYLVDPTNCDGDGNTTTIGYPDKLFLKKPTGVGGTSENPTYTYTFDGANSCTFVYDSDTVELLGSKILTLAESDYIQCTEHTGGTATCKDKAVCTLCGLPYGEVSTEAHVYDNACDNACNGCGATRTITHTFGDWTVTTAPTTEAKGVETRSCSVCKATETRDIAQLAPEEKKLGTGVIVAIVAGSVVVVGAIAIVAIWVVKSRAAGTAAAETVSWRTKKYRKAKWKKRK